MTIKSCRTSLPATDPWPEILTIGCSRPRPCLTGILWPTIWQLATGKTAKSRGNNAKSNHAEHFILQTDLPRKESVARLWGLGSTLA